MVVEERMVTPVQGRALHTYIHQICGVDSLELSRDYSHGQLLCVHPAYPIPSVHTAVSSEAASSKLPQPSPASDQIQYNTY